MEDDSLMPWGKYKNEKIANVPADYLIWLLENEKCGGEVKKYIEENLDVLKEEVKLKNKNRN